MEDFIGNLAIASFGMIIAGALFLVFLNWLEEQILIMQSMDLGDWIGLGIFFGVAALVASTM